VALESKDEKFLMEIGMELHVAGEL